MMTRQKLRSEETKQAILSAAGKLFADRGYDGVAMREIAKEAGCSHTTIYIYFKDKEVLLHALSMPPLIELKENFEQLVTQSQLAPETKLIEMSMRFIRFCLLHRSIYSVVFIAKGERVDKEQQDLEINETRVALFKQLGQVLQDVLPLPLGEERLLQFNRIYFFMLHGIVSTYSHTEEPLTDIMDRLSSTFETAFDALLNGFKLKMTNGG
ncbi:TetR/AcrR family transcriptional regulator [Cohnella soli]|uniref:TetR/AcrR family transcriptional regulator n=1 Tax=Cohnella soli TaxID=425005 RepID=A0ABW0I1K9_9BACL